MFVDKIKIFIEAGRGGNGCVSFRREKFVPYGGPDGGNGGKGGDVYLRANENLSTLYDFLLHPHYKSQPGEHGKGKNMHGKDGKDLIIDVPCGTVVYKLIEPSDSTKNREPQKILLSDLKNPNDMVLVARGGRGGRGNAMFKTSTNQAPKIAELGEPGEKVTLLLELKLIADVGIIGLPNAGKSTLLSVITSAKPKIADYPFTTLSPNLGVCVYKTDRIVFADIPGIIENAHKGKGLGIEFLRHIERTRMLLHLIDVTAHNEIYKNFVTVMKELKEYSLELYKKPMIVVLTKTDLLPKSNVEKLLLKFVKKIKHKIIPISAVTKQNITLLLNEVVNVLNKIKQKSTVESQESLSEKEYKIYQYKPEIEVIKQQGKFILRGENIERIVKMTNFELEESVKRLQKILKKVGVEKILKKRGIKPGDKVVIADIEFEYFEEDTKSE